MKYLFTLLLLLILSSCGANKFLTSTVPANKIKEVNYFEPLSYIQLIKKGNKSELNDSLSKITEEKLDSLLVKNKSELRLNNEIAFTNDTLKTKIELELNYLARLIRAKRTLKAIPLPSTIDSLIEENNQRFALSIVATGFGRRKGNYGGQVAKGVGMGILTLGLYTPVPIKSNLSLFAFIFDSEKNEIAYYKKLNPITKEPSDPDVIANQLHKLFDGYFYNEK